jgi:DNA modification methylase
MSAAAWPVVIENQKSSCTIILGDSREELRQYKNQVDLIVTSPPYADARKNHYDSVHPDKFVDWFMTFHEPFYEALKPEGSLIINIKDKVVDGMFGGQLRPFVIVAGIQSKIIFGIKRIRCLGTGRIVCVMGGSTVFISQNPGSLI